MFVTAIQGLIGAFHENLSPLDQASGGEARNHTDKYFLDKGRVHFFSVRAREVPWLRLESGDAGNRSASAAGSYNRDTARHNGAKVLPFLPKSPLAGLHYPQTKE